MLKLMRLPEVEAATGYSRTTIWRREQAGEFPKRRRIGPHLVAWRSDEIEEWIRNLPVRQLFKFKVALLTKHYFKLMRLVK